MLSILIPAYNYNVFSLTAEVHRQCIVSGIEFEIITVDDGSKSELNVENQAINSLSYCSFRELNNNIGRSAVRDMLAKQAKYNWLLFLDADVMPASAQFIENYVTTLNGQAKVVFGGYAYEKNPPENNRMLRYRYGKEREEKTAAIRNKNPYGSIFSGNLLIDKQVFFDSNYSMSEHYYGLDNFLAYSLYASKIPVLHIDNPIYHLGLDTNETFFEKSLQSVAVRKKLLAAKPGINHINSLLKYYSLLQKWRLCKVASVAFKLAGPFLKKRILTNKAGLIWLDIYRLGYICHIKE